MEQNKEKKRHILQYYYDKGKNASHPIKFVQFMDPIQFPFPPHNDGFNVFVLVQRSGRPVVEIAIKSLN